MLAGRRRRRRGGDTRQWPRAEQELDEALADRSLAAVPQLWRAAGRIAAQQGKITKAVLCDERALGLEYRGWNRLLDQDRRRDEDAARRGVGGPGQGDADRLADLSLPTIRAQHQAMLDRYAAVAQALASSQAGPDRELVAGVIRTADRWRSLDGDERAACNAAAKALRRLGAQDLAWDYLTTPLAGGPTEPKAWTALAGELVRGGFLGRTHIGLDYFDASINRVAAWVIGTRAMLKALLIALLEPRETLQQAENAGDFTSRLALMEEAKALPWPAVWDYYCQRHSVPPGRQWLQSVKEYERNVLALR